MRRDIYDLVFGLTWLGIVVIGVVVYVSDWKSWLKRESKGGRMIDVLALNGTKGLMRNNRVNLVFCLV